MVDVSFCSCEPKLAAKPATVAECIGFVCHLFAEYRPLGGRRRWFLRFSYIISTDTVQLSYVHTVLVQASVQCIANTYLSKILQFLTPGTSCLREHSLLSPRFLPSGCQLFRAFNPKLYHVTCLSPTRQTVILTTLYLDKIMKL